MSGSLRKVPRIMAKSSRASKVTSTSSAHKIEHNKPEGNSIRPGDLDEDHEQLLVRDGIVVGLQQPDGHFVDEAGVQVASSVVRSNSRTRRIIIESTIENNDYEPYVPTTLPGIADEVESYPCPLCPERVFLTSFGLERHSTEKHPEHYHEILEHIEAIGVEWRRREEELAKRRDRVYTTRLRQETIAKHAIEQVVNGTLGQYPGCSESSETVPLHANMDENLNETESERRFKACNLCGILVGANSPAAMESHLRAHKKNDDLKMKLLARYGAEEVGRLMCRECNMVFGDESGLLMHNDQMHVRKRRYVCKWCGHVTNTMTELNMHKADVHAMPPFTIRSDRDRMLRKRNIHGLIALGAHPKQNEIEDHHGSTITSNSSLNFRTACEQCGLRLVRPSLLVRHMLRVHSKSTFSCEIEVPDTCNYRIDVDCERITWTCCDTQYTSRREFFFHRVNNHLNKITDNVTGNLCITHQDSSFPSGSLTSGVNICSGNSGSTLDYVCETTTELDGNMRFVVPQEVVGSDGEFFIVVESNSDDHGKDIGGAETSDNRMQKMNDGLQQPQIHSDLISSSSKSQEILVETVDQSLDQIVTITAEQYEQLQSQYGSSLDEMSVVYVDRDDASRDVLVGDIKETYECDPRALCN